METMLTTSDLVILPWLPTYSLVGQYIAYVRNFLVNNEAENDIWVMRTDGSGAMKVPGSEEIGFFDWNSNQ